MVAFAGVTFSPFSKLAGGGASVLVDNEDVIDEYMTGVPGSSVASTIAANDATQVCRIAVHGANVWVTIGSAPTAAVGTKFLILDGTVEYFAVNVGDHVAIFEPA